jgi:hypothetical protein
LFQDEVKRFRQAAKYALEEMKFILAIWRIEANGIISSASNIALSVIEKHSFFALSSASGSFSKMTSFRIYFVTIEDAMASDLIACVSLVWTSWLKALSVKKHNN